MGLGMGFVWLLLLAIVAIVFFRGFSSRGADTSQDNVGAKSALDILNERYARGEIDKVEYEQKKHDMQ